MTRLNLLETKFQEIYWIHVIKDFPHVNIVLQESVLSTVMLQMELVLFYYPKVINTSGH